MLNHEQYRKGVRAPGGKIKDFFFWLKGLWAPKYVPVKSRYNDRKEQMTDASLLAEALKKRKYRCDDE